MFSETRLQDHEQRQSLSVDQWQGQEDSGPKALFD